MDIEKYRLEEKKGSKENIEKKIALEEERKKEAKIKEEQAKAEEEEEVEIGWPGERKRC